MEGFLGLVVLLAVGALVCGPIALAVSLAALRHIREIEDELRTLKAVSAPERRVPVRPRLTGIPRVGEETGPEPEVEPAPAPPDRVQPQDVNSLEQPERRAYPQAAPEPAAPAQPGEADAGQPPRIATPADTVCDVPRSFATQAPSEAAGLEQRIGTRWVLIAGVITVIFAVGFFLKYAYDNQWIGPLGRVTIATFGGLLALAIGEMTRRRGYDFVARGVTALGFAILYATVFAAHRWYALIGSAPAYGLAIAITTAAMLYAVVLDEVFAAVLALVGGYVAPLVLSRGENLPTLLFSYVLILSGGALLCAYWRKWNTVSILAFLGTYVLYTGWFEKFYRPAMELGSTKQLGVALVWLSLFFLIYLVLPLVHTLIRRVRSQVQDMILALADGGIVFYYLATMLMDRYENWLALCSLLMGMTYLGLTALVSIRCRADVDLLNALLVVGLSFASLAVPLYYEMNAAAAIWALEAIGLAAIGLRYRNTLVQIAAGVMVTLALGNLMYRLPMHTGPFHPVFNVAFGTWSLVAAAVLVGHIFYRRDKHLDAHIRHMVTQVLYAIGLLLLMATVSMELWHHSDLNASSAAGPGFYEQMPMVFGIFVLLFVGGSLPPRGPVCPVVAAVLGAAGSIFLTLAYPRFHTGSFTILANYGFVRALALTAALFAAVWLLRRRKERLEEELVAAAVLVLLGVLLLWVVLTEEIWFHYRYQRVANWRLLAHMYISVMWAVYASVLMAIGFWQRVRPLRYLALGIFVLLLAKIFLIDTRTLDTAYRIAGFLATGLALVGVSYLYQYLKKIGFFDTKTRVHAIGDRNGQHPPRG
jgi:uncharacterized membrane protein